MSHTTKSETPTAPTVEASGEKTQSSNKRTFDMNSTVTTPARTINVSFYDAALSVIEHDGQPYAPMKDALRSILEANDQRLVSSGNKDQAGKFMQQGWSKLKSYFKVPYRQIPQAEFTSAV